MPTDKNNHSRIIRDLTDEIIGNTEATQLVQGSTRQKEWAVEIRNVLIDRLTYNIQDCLAAGYRQTKKFEETEETAKIKKAIDGLKAETSAPALIEAHQKYTNNEGIIRHYAKDPAKISKIEREAAMIANSLTITENCTKLKIGSEKQQKWGNSIREEFLGRLGGVIQKRLLKAHEKTGTFETSSIAKIKLAIEALKNETDAKILIDLSLKSPSEAQIIDYYLLIYYSLNNQAGLSPLLEDAPKHTVKAVAKLRADRIYRLTYKSSLSQKSREEQIQVLVALQKQTSAKFWVRAYKLDTAELLSELGIK